MRSSIVLVLLSMTVPAHGVAQAVVPREFDAYVETARRDWGVPGVAVAIVRDSAVVLARGYGLRRAGTGAAVDAHTVFGVGSVTKSFTAALIGMLVDDGRLRWDDPVRARLPGFAVADSYVSRSLTIRDLLAHRTGVARTDMLWLRSGMSREELVRRLRFAPPTRGFRAGLTYHNVMYVAAASLAESAGGQSWDALVRTRILDPLGMGETSTSVKELARWANVAVPHVMSGDSMTAIPWLDTDNVAPAAGLSSSASDMARWIRFQLDSGRVAGRALLSRGALLQTRRPHVVVPLDSAARRQNPHRHLRAYALGWYVEDYRGREVVYHPGSTDGMSALVALVPEERAGVVILANMQGTSLTTALMYRVIDELLGAPRTDWSTVLLADHRRAIARGRGFEERDAAARIPDTRPSSPLAHYAGSYVDSLYGTVSVQHAAGRLTIVASPGLRGELRHWQHDTFRTRWEGVLQEGDTEATFELDERGVPVRMRLDIEGTVVFHRIDVPRAARSAKEH